MTNRDAHGREYTSPDMIRAVAVANGVCVRPIMQRLVDTLTGREQLVPIDCGSTQDRKCPTCAERNRRLRMQQCREGWHTTEETLPPLPEPDDNDDEAEDEDEPEDGRRRLQLGGCGRRGGVRTCRTCPGFRSSTGRSGGRSPATTARLYRPSMFVTTTLGSYGRGAPRWDPGRPGDL